MTSYFAIIISLFCLVGVVSKSNKVKDICVVFAAILLIAQIVLYVKGV